MSQPSDTTMIRFEDVSLRFDEVKALDHVSFQLQPGESAIIFGAAGSGKTVLIKTAVGLIKPSSGRIFLFGQEITAMTEHELFDLRSRVGILFQEGGLFDSLTIEENVAYPLLNQRVRVERPDPAAVENKVKETLRFVELEQTLEQFPSELSGGMRRRVGIARAVVTEPAVVLYDSPTAGLDPITANTIVALILKERDSRNAATMMVTHRYQDGKLMANFRYNPGSGSLERLSGNGSGDRKLKTKFMVMHEGRLVFEGSEKELESSRDPYVSKFVRR
jgi:phospholipid/cholesterol/gamma-HCH transport system ATP-binding protein